MTLCNMVIEAGGKNGVIPADKTTYDYLKVSFNISSLAYDKSTYDRCLNYSLHLLG